MRETWVYSKTLRKIVRKTRHPSHQAAGPSIISDSMADTWHPATGKTYSSKSAFRAETKARGLVEYGNEPIAAPKPVEMSPVSETMRRAIAQVRAGHRPAPLGRADQVIPITRIKHG